MERLERIFLLHRLLSGRRVSVSRQEIETTLECSRATVTRTIATMRDWFGAPIVFDAEKQGYRYDLRGGANGWELPGLWFTSAELRALLAISDMLESLSNGALSEELAPLRRRVSRLLGAQRRGADGQRTLLRVTTSRQRSIDPNVFKKLADALHSGRRIRASLRKPGGSISRRTLSPQQLAYCGNNWYLLAWCHKVQQVRVFPLDRFDELTLLTREAEVVPEQDLAQLESPYGTTPQGDQEHVAVLRFSPSVADRIALESWHPRQQSRWLDDGAYELRVPYGNAAELLRDLLSQGPDVEVLEPPELRAALVDLLRGMQQIYARTETPS